MKLLGYLQRLGRSLMLPVAVLPAAAIFLRFGSADLLGRFFKAGDDNFLRAAGKVAFDYLPLLIAGGVAIGMSEDEHGSVVIAAILGYYAISKVGLSTAKLIYGQVGKWDVGTMGGLVAGLVASYSYNKFKDIEFPDLFAFFAAKRFVPMATLFFSTIVAFGFGLLWPPLQNGIQSFYNVVFDLQRPLQTFAYITSERLLVPFGLHHILNALFIFDPTYGDSILFFKEKIGSGYIMAGSYPLKMFILPALAWTIWQAADKENKNSIKTLMLSGAAVTFVTGITEPIEFAFLFANPVLYLVYALWAGLWGAVASWTGALHGYGFAAGLIDYVLNFGIATKPILLLGVGVISGVASIFFFSFMIRIIKMPTPGRGNASVAKESVMQMPSKKSISKSSDGKLWIEALGGRENIVKSTNCATRLRLELKNTGKINVSKAKSLGAVEVLKLNEKSAQVIIGPKAQFVGSAIAKELKSS